jgi:hypothetical protein
MKFENIIFNTKDVIMIVGCIASAFTFYQSIDSRLDAFELKVQNIISENEINNVKINARIDGIKTANNEVPKTKTMIQLVAVCNDTRLQIVKKKLFKYKLV